MVSYAISELKEVNKSTLSKENRLKPSPIFDCGAGLLSDLQIDCPLNMPIEVCWQRVKAKPLAGRLQSRLLSLTRPVVNHSHLMWLP